MGQSVSRGDTLFADTAPSEPARRVATSWVYCLRATLRGPSFLRQVELGYAILGMFGRLAARQKGEGIGQPVWRTGAPDLPLSHGPVALTLLGVGSFDGLNETFWWIGMIGINPPEFPGRSAANQGPAAQSMAPLGPWTASILHCPRGTLMP